MMTYSVIIPVYNTEKYLRRCLDSVLAYQGDLEVIALDDGSTDGSLAILQNYSDPRLKVLHHENMGLFKTWKRGVELSTGDYIIFIDSDDYINAAILETIFQTVETYKPDLLQTNWIEFDDKSSIQCSPTYLQSGMLSGKPLEVFLDENVFRMERGYISFPITRWAKVFKAELLKRILPDLMDNITQYEDISMIVPFLSQIKSLYYLPVDFYRYLLRVGSMSKAYEKLPQYYEDCRRMNLFLREKKELFGFSEVFLDRFYVYYYLDITAQAILHKQYPLAKTVLRDEKLCRLLSEKTKLSISRKSRLKIFFFQHHMFWVYRFCVKLRKMLQK